MSLLYRKAFTLIELLVVIVTIGILAGILFVSITGAMGNATDARRKADIANLYSSILSKGSSASYPNLVADISESSPTELKQFINTYLASIPTDPKGTHEYFYYSDGKDFAVGAVLEDGTCFVKQTSNLFDAQSCTKLKEGGIGLVQNFMVLGGGGTYNLSWTIPSSFNLSNATTSTALICLGKTKTDPNPPTETELLSSGILVAIINNTNTYRYYASNADYNYYCKAITYDNTQVTNPGTPGESPNTGSGGFDGNNSTGGTGSGSSGSGNNYGSSTPNPGTSTPASAPPSPSGSNEPGGTVSPNFTVASERNSDGTGNITLSWVPGNMSTHTIIRRTESTSADPSIAPKTLSDGIEVYNKANNLDANDNPISTSVLHSYTDSGLNGSKYYCYSAWAYDSVSNTYSNGYVLACSGVPPTPVSELSLSSTTSAFNLSWTKGTGDKTLIRRKLNSAPTSFVDGELIYADTGINFTDDGSSTSTVLAKNTTYCYSVWSYTSTPGVPSSSTASACAQLSNIGNPTNLTFPTLAYNSIVLNWNAADGATSYVVVRKQDSIPASRTDGVEAYNSSSTSFMDNGLTDNIQYCYAVWGYDGVNYSEVPATGCATTLKVWATGYSYSKAHTIVGSTIGAQSNYQMKLKIYRTTGTDSGDTVYLESKVDATYKDIYFTASDRLTPLSYWIESYNSTYATVWVKIPSIPASPNTTTMYLYYGNTSTASASDGNNTFIFFDHFNGTSLDTGKWTTISQGSTTLTIADSYARMYSASGNANRRNIMSKQSIANNVAIEMNYRLEASRYEAWYGFSTSYNATYYHQVAGYFSRFIIGNGYGGSRTLMTHNGSANLSSGDDVADVWTKGKIINTPSYQAAYINDNLKASLSSSIGSYDYRVFLGEVSPYNSNFYIDVDWIFVRNIVLPEPTHSSWGSEES